ncbi:hypothetical protein BDZ89DRAFT_358591 [Hymenopellis radicata]|nr:hypothetical protein BDZ89DRAFT_358591 [Hymenopellis radicata]
MKSSTGSILDVLWTRSSLPPFLFATQLRWLYSWPFKAPSVHRNSWIGWYLGVCDEYGDLFLAADPRFVFTASSFDTEMLLKPARIRYPPSYSMTRHLDDRLAIIVLILFMCREALGRATLVLNGDKFTLYPLPFASLSMQKAGVGARNDPRDLSTVCNVLRRGALPAAWSCFPPDCQKA